MATTEQINANRENAKLSTGPTSEIGLERSSQNARKHGLTGRTIHLTKSEEEPYRQLCEGLFASLNPKGAHEEYLVESIVDCRWRIGQISRIEAGLYALGEIEHAELFAKHPAQKAEDLCRAHTFTLKQKEFDKLNRYQGRLERQAALDLKKLEELQAVRKAQELKDFQDAGSLWVQSVNTQQPFDPADFGFVWSEDQLFDSVGGAKQRFDARSKFPIAHFVTYSDIPPVAA
jgi:hypothetical protein